MANLEYSKVFKSIAGIDITPIINGKSIGTLQQLTIMSNRDMAAWWGMGSVNARGIAKGKRALGGTLNFLNINRHALLAIAKAGGQKYWGYTHEHRSTPDNSSALNVNLASIMSFEERQTADTATYSATANPEIGFNKTWYDPTFADQMPPFDIVLSAATETGLRAKMVIYGAQVMNDGISVSMEDLVMEQQMQYLALDMDPWTFVDQRTQNGTSLPDQPYF